MRLGLGLGLTWHSCHPFPILNDSTSPDCAVHSSTFISSDILGGLLVWSIFKSMRWITKDADRASLFGTMSSETTPFWTACCSHMQFWATQSCVDESHMDIFDSQGPIPCGGLVSSRSYAVLDCRPASMSTLAWKPLMPSKPHQTECRGSVGMTYMVRLWNLTLLEPASISLHFEYVQTATKACKSSFYVFQFHISINTNTLLYTPIDIGVSFTISAPEYPTSTLYYDTLPTR